MVTSVMTTSMANTVGVMIPSRGPTPSTTSSVSPRQFSLTFEVWDTDQVAKDANWTGADAAVSRIVPG
ncbi:hypothetical protein GCM10014713_52470 [Streptomyces purpureus]|uniref:Uncharacterized protein n=1 Tax=Streptomyces purpureus TaxID=1951 RepID=A0A918LUL7_9ACTN|nr:hypothetical protein GCM10014713_52470 [Streptomyces purpureus]